ncbi:hypothetical protein CGCFRS4_v003050 [Colletotrichum fructicola]|nr:hypothetical protein CGCFRS4_v003050 [Colletotrichum fructicola]
MATAGPRRRRQQDPSMPTLTPSPKSRSDALDHYYSTGGAIDTYVRINRKYGYSQLARGHGSEKNVNKKQRP